MPTIKLVVIGSSGVGKTSLRGQYISGRFSNGYRATIGADFISKTLPHPTNPEDNVVLQIWDTAGQERFSSLSSAFFRGADAVLLLFDVTTPDTLISLKKWWEEFKEKAPLDDKDMEDYCCIVVGNKIDLRAEQEGCVAESEALEFLDELVPPSSPRPQATDSQTSSIPMPPSSSQAIPVLQNVSPTMSRHSPTAVTFSQPPSSGRSSSRLYGTATSTRTSQSIYHTPSSSFFDTFHSARTSPESGPSTSPAPSSSFQSRSRRTTKLSTGSGSSAATITPSIYLSREPVASASPETTVTIPELNPSPTAFHRSPLPIAPERGPKLFFTSAKTGEGVADVFEYIAHRVIAKWAYDEQMDARLLHYREGSGDDTIRLGLRNASGKQNGAMVFGGRQVSDCCS